MRIVSVAVHSFRGLRSKTLTLGDGLNTIGDVELLVDVLEVGADRRFGKTEDLGGLVVRQAFRDDL